MAAGMRAFRQRRVMDLSGPPVTLPFYWILRKPEPHIWTKRLQFPLKRGAGVGGPLPAGGQLLSKTLAVKL